MMEAQMTIKVIGEHKVVKVQNLLRKSIAELSDINARESDFFATIQVYFVNKFRP